MTTFRERKQDRIAAGTQPFKFEVISSSLSFYGGEVLASFSSRKAADEFAFRQIGSTAGNTKAHRLLEERYPMSDAHNTQNFRVERVNLETGERQVCRRPDFA